MTLYLTLILTGTAFGLTLTPLVGAASRAFGLVDAPGGRKVHLVSVPRLGGVAVIGAATLALMVSQVTPGVGSIVETLRPVTPILIGAGLVFAVGVLDDLRPLPPWPKLCVQIIAAVVVMASGLLIERITIAGQTWQLGIWSWPLTLLWIVGLTNAFNFIDGIDGLAAGISVIAGATCAAILISRGHVPEAMLLAALVGATLGFLVYNFAPASIFLGDGGSLPVGFVLATTAITGWQKGATALAAGVPLLIFALPIADTTSALARRLFRPSERDTSIAATVRRIFEPDRDHIHHRLLALGLSTRRTVVTLYLMTLVLALIALSTAQFN
jgi:UDP-GlcNAc:undecaprenyl-phosphate GlcNAc-1-phosphate transferase